MLGRNDNLTSMEVRTLSCKSLTGALSCMRVASNNTDGWDHALLRYLTSTSSALAALNFSITSLNKDNARYLAGACVHPWFVESHDMKLSLIKGSIRQNEAPCPGIYAESKLQGHYRKLRESYRSLPFVRSTVRCELRVFRSFSKPPSSGPRAQFDIEQGFFRG